MSTGSNHQNAPLREFEKDFFSRKPVSRFTLSNGLTVLTQGNHELPVASILTFFKAGSRNERPGITGISHLFEHMMFNGSRKFGPKEFDRMLESGGGYSNAYTSRDITVYYEDFASHLLETVIELDSDRMGWLNLSEESLKSERGVVMEERRMRTENSVYGRLEEELFAASFQSHSYRWPVIGWMPDIEHISLEDCRKYYEKYYSPNNALVMLSGDFNSDSAHKLFEKFYGEIPQHQVPQPPVTSEPPQCGEKRVLYKKQSELHNFIVGYHIPEAGHKDIYVLDLLQIILTEGDSSLLYRKIVREKGIALYLFSDVTWHFDPGLYVLFMQMKPGFTSENGEKTLEKELQKIKDKGISEIDLERAQNIAVADFIYSMQTNNGRAHRIGLTEILLGNYSDLFVPLAEYQKVTVEDVSRVLNEYFVKDNKTVVTLLSD